MMGQNTQDRREVGRRLIAEAQAARIQAHVRTVLSRISAAAAVRGKQPAGTEQRLIGFARRGNCGRGKTA